MADVRKAELALARDPSTPLGALQDLLSRQATRQNKVVAAIAGNPNASWPLLAELLPHCPDEVVTNPALPFLWLADPRLPFPLPGEALSALSTRVDALSAAMGWPSPQGEAPLAALQLALCVFKALGDRWLKSNNYRRSYQRIEELSWLMRRGITGHAELPETLWRHLARSDNVWVRREAANWTPADTAQELLLDDAEVHIQLINNGKLLPCYVEALAESADPLVRAQVAARPKLCPVVVARLARDPAPGVRRAVAARDDLPELLKMRLSIDEDTKVRLKIRPRTP